MMEQAKRLIPPLPLLACLLLWGKVAHPQPSLEGLWNNEAGVQVQVIQSGDAIIGFIPETSLEVLRGQVFSGGSAGWRVEGGILAELDEGEVKSECHEYARSWLRAAWDISPDGSVLRGRVQPLHIEFTRTTGECISSPISAEPSVFTRERSTHRYCVQQDGIEAWRKSLLPTIERYYSRREAITYSERFWREVSLDTSSVWVPESLELHPVPAPVFHIDAPQSRELHLDRAQWAISNVWLGTETGVEGLSSGNLGGMSFGWDEQLWYRLPTSDGGKGTWERYQVCKYDVEAAELAVCSGAKPDEVGQEVIETVITSGSSLASKVGVRALKGALQWVSRHTARSTAASVGDGLVSAATRSEPEELVAFGCEIAFGPLNRVPADVLTPEEMLEVILNLRTQVGDAPRDYQISAIRELIESITREMGDAANGPNARRLFAELLEARQAAAAASGAPPIPFPGNQLSGQPLRDHRIGVALDDIIRSGGLNWRNRAAKIEAAEQLARDHSELFDGAVPDISELNRIRRAWHGRRAGSGWQTFAIGQLIGPDGRVFAHELGAYTSGRQLHLSTLQSGEIITREFLENSLHELHAEGQLVAALEARIKGTFDDDVRALSGGRLQVMVDQLPCSRTGHVCAQRLAEFAELIGVDLEVYVPTIVHRLGPPGSPKTAATSWTRLGRDALGARRLPPRR